MAKTKTLYLANDGTEFETIQEADAHDVTLVKGGHIEAYIQAAGLEKAQAGLMRKHLACYIAFCESDPDASAETPAERAAVAKAAEKEAKAAAAASAAAAAAAAAAEDVPASDAEGQETPEA